VAIESFQLNAYKYSENKHYNDELCDTEKKLVKNADKLYECHVRYDDYRITATRLWSHVVEEARIMISVNGGIYYYVLNETDKSLVGAIQKLRHAHRGMEVVISVTQAV